MDTFLVLFESQGRDGEGCHSPKIFKSIKELNEMLPKELDNQYELNILCNHYTSVVKAKWNCFMSHVEELKHVLNDIDTPIVGFTGLFVQIMTTPLKLKDWCARIWKLDHVIYMRSAKEKDLPNNLSEANNALMNFHRPLKLAEEEEDKVLYEKEKFFKVSSVQVNEHHLFTMNEVNAVEEDEDGRLSEIKISFKTLGNCENFYRNKFFTLWSHALLSGQKNILFGIKGKDMKLQRIFSMEANTEAMVEEMKRESGSLAWNPDDILNFLYRFLTFVKMVMKDERVTNGRVVSFIYKKGQKKLGQYKKGFDHIYPKFENYDYKHVPDWDLITE